MRMPSPKNITATPLPAGWTNPAGVDPAEYAVLQEVRDRTLTTSCVLLRKLHDVLRAIEETNATAAAAALKPNRRRSNAVSSEHSAISMRSDNRSELYTSNTAGGSSAADDVPSLFIPTLKSESDSMASRAAVEGQGGRGGLDNSSECTSKDDHKTRFGFYVAVSVLSPGSPEKARREKIFPYPRGRWECGTFLGKRVYIETDNVFLGRGSTAIVMGGDLIVSKKVRGKERRLGSVRVAIKSMSSNVREKLIADMCERALNVRMKMLHPGVVHMYYLGTYYPPFAELPELDTAVIRSHLVLACSKTGSVADVLKRTGPLPEAEVQLCMAEMLATLQVLHEEYRHVHNDVKPHNILIFEDPAEPYANYKYQLTDFMGVAPCQTAAEVIHNVRAEPNKNRLSITVGGTAAYMSPEACLGLGVLPSNDIWSLGITAYHMATNTLPWKPLERQFPSMVLNGYRCKYDLRTIFGKHFDGFLNTLSNSDSANYGSQPGLTSDEDKRMGEVAAPRSTSTSTVSSESSSSHAQYADFGPILEELANATLSHELRDFITQCLIENPVDRPTAKTLRNHSFVKGVPVGRWR